MTNHSAPDRARVLRRAPPFGLGWLRPAVAPGGANAENRTLTRRSGKASAFMPGAGIAGSRASIAHRPLGISIWPGSSAGAFITRRGSARIRSAGRVFGRQEGTGADALAPPDPRKDAHRAPPEPRMTPALLRHASHKEAGGRA